MAEDAAAALPRDGAVRRDAVGRGREDLLHPPEGVGAQRLHHPHAQHVSLRRAGDKDGDAVRPHDARALGGVARDLCLIDGVLLKRRPVLLLTHALLSLSRFLSL